MGFIENKFISKKVNYHTTGTFFCGFLLCCGAGAARSRPFFLEPEPSLKGGSGSGSGSCSKSVQVKLLPLISKLVFQMNLSATWKHFAFYRLHIFLTLFCWSWSWSRSQSRQNKKFWSWSRQNGRLRQHWFFRSSGQWGVTQFLQPGLQSSDVGSQSTRIRMAGRIRIPIFIF